MRKNVFGRRFKRDSNERKALFKGLISSLILYEKIKTTEEKAKSIKGQVDKLVTKARKNQHNATSLLLRDVTAKAADKLVNDIATRFGDRTSGYTRAVRLGERLNDNASMVLMEWVEGKKAQSKTEKPKEKESKKEKVVVKEAKKEKVKAGKKPAKKKE